MNFVGFGPTPGFGSGTSGFGKSLGSHSSNSALGGLFNTPSSSSPFGTSNTTNSTFGLPQNTSNSFGLSATSSGGFVPSTPGFSGTTSFASSNTPFASSINNNAFNNNNNGFGSASKATNVFGSSTSQPQPFGTSPSSGFNSNNFNGGFNTAIASSPSPFGLQVAQSIPFGCGAGAGIVDYSIGGGQKTGVFGTTTNRGNKSFGSTANSNLGGSFFGGTPSLGTQSNLFTGGGFGSSTSYRETPDADTPNGRFVSVSAMPQYKKKNHEELRFEYYEKGFSSFGVLNTSLEKEGSALAASPFVALAASSSPFGSSSNVPFGGEGGLEIGSSSNNFFLSKTNTVSNPFFASPLFGFGESGANFGNKTTTSFPSIAFTGFSNSATQQTNKGVLGVGNDGGFSFGSYGKSLGEGITSVTAPSTSSVNFHSTPSKVTFCAAPSSSNFSTEAKGGYGFPTSKQQFQGVDGSGGCNLGTGFGCKPTSFSFSTRSPFIAKPSSLSFTSTSSFGTQESNKLSAKGEEGGRSFSGTGRVFFNSSLFNSSTLPAPNLLSNPSSNIFGGSSFLSSGTANQISSSFSFPSSSNTVSSSLPSSLIAGFNSVPYGTGDFGAGLVEQRVKAALALPVGKEGCEGKIGIGLPQDKAITNGCLSYNCFFFYGRSIKGQATVKPRNGRIRQSLNSISNSLSSSLKFSGTAHGSLFDGSLDNEVLSPIIFTGNRTKRLVVEEHEQREGKQHAKQKLSLTSQIEGNSFLEVKYPNSPSFAVFLNSCSSDFVVIRLQLIETGEVHRIQIKRTSKIEELDPKVFSLFLKSGIQDLRLENLLYIFKGKTIAPFETINELEIQNEDLISIVKIKKRSKKEQEQPLKLPVVLPETIHNFVSYEAFYNNHSTSFKKMKKNNTALLDEQEDKQERLDDLQDIEGKHFRSSLPKLTKDGYETIPSFSLIKCMTDKELSCILNFTIIAKDFGSVCWVGRTDIRFLNLDVLVEFKRREITVYSKEEEKPAIGKGLNKPAIIELYHIFPKKEQEKEKYALRVKEQTLNLNAKLIHYKVETGVWKFRTEHFSRYGLIDEDSEDDDERNVPKKDKNIISSTPCPLRSYSSKSLILPLEDSMEIDRQQQMHRIPKLNCSLPSQLRIDANRLQILKSSLISNKKIEQDHEKNHYYLKTPLFFQVMNQHEQHTKNRLLHYQNQYFSRSKIHEQDEKEQKQYHQQLHFYQPMLSSLSFKDFNSLGFKEDKGQENEKELSEVYKLFKTVFVDEPLQTKEHIVDFSLFMGRSFRCSWGPSGELVIPRRFYLSSSSSSLGFCSSAGKLKFLIVIKKPFGNGFIPKQRLESELLVHLKSSQHQKPEKHIFYSFPKGPSDAFSNIINLYRSNSRSFNNPSGHHSYLIWNLVNALWCNEQQEQDRKPKHAAKEGEYPPNKRQRIELPINDDFDEALHSESLCMYHMRREAISKWLEEAVQERKITSKEEKETGLDKVISLLCVHLVEEASEVAFSTGFCRLATLIAQAQVFKGSDFRELVKKQMEFWRANGANCLINKKILFICSLLSGDISTCILPKDWLSSLGLFLWYKNGPGEPLGRALKSYDKAVQELKAYPPLPYHCSILCTDEKSEKNTDKENNLKKKPENKLNIMLSYHKKQKIKCYSKDVLYHLLSLFCDNTCSVKSLLSPLSYSPDLFDYSTSWHLYSILVALGFNISLETEFLIRSSFIHQLEQANLKKWTVYVSMNISNLVLRNELTQELLIRHWPFIQEEESFLTFDLKVPYPWIYKAKAIYCSYKNMNLHKIYNLCLSQDCKDALEAFCELAPDLLLQGDFESIKTVMNALPELFEVNEKYASGDFDDINIKYTLVQEQIEQDIKKSRSNSSNSELLKDEKENYFHLMNNILNLTNFIISYKSSNEWKTEKKKEIDNTSISWMIQSLAKFSFYCYQKQERKNEKNNVKRRNNTVNKNINIDSFSHRIKKKDETCSTFDGSLQIDFLDQIRNLSFSNIYGEQFKEQSINVLLGDFVSSSCKTISTSTKF